MEYTYYTQEYQEYAEELKDIDSVRDFKDTITENVETVTELHNQLQADLEGMAGDFYEVLTNSTLGSVLTQLQELKSVIEGKLGTTITTCEKLATGLESLKNTEDSLIGSKTQKTTLENNPVSRGTYDEETDTYSNQENYDAYVTQLKELNETIDTLVTQCEKLKTQDDKDIETIKSFNESVEEFSSQLFSLSLAFGKTDFTDFQNLSTEEKQKIIQEFVDSLQEAYKQIKKDRESNKYNSMKAVFTAMGLDYFSDGNGKTLSVKGYLELMNFLYTTDIETGKFDELGRPITRSPIEIINAYFNGEDWKTSGMYNMVASYCNTVNGQSDPQWEKDFIKRLVANLSDDPDMLVGAKNEQDLYALLNDSDNSDIIDKVKNSFVNEGYLNGLNKYVEDLDNMYEFVGESGPVLLALDMGIDWTNNEAGIQQDVLMDYLNGGSWEETLGKYVDFNEDEFIQKVTDANNYMSEIDGDGYFPEKTIEEIKEMLQSDTTKESIAAHYDMINTKNDNNVKDLEQMVTYSESIYGLNKIKDLVPYLEIQSTDEFKDHITDSGMKNGNWLLTEDGQKLDSGVTDGYKYNELFNNMSDDERKMFSYLYDKEGLNSARDYLKDNADSINRRIGTEKGENFVKWVKENNLVSEDDYVKNYVESGYGTAEEAHDKAQEMLKKQYVDDLVGQGYNRERANELWAEHDSSNDTIRNNTLVDSIVDTVNTGAKGVGDGFEKLCGNIGHLVEPEYTKSVNDYEMETIAKLFNDPDSPYYDQALSTTYSAGTIIGEKGLQTVLKAIPATKIMGEGLEFASNSGETRNEAFQKTGDYAGSLAYGVIDSAIDATVSHYAPSISKSFENAGVSGSANKFLSSLTTGTITNTAKSANEAVFVDKDMGAFVDNFAQGEVGVVISSATSAAKSEWGSTLGSATSLPKLGENVSIKEMVVDKVKETGVDFIKEQGNNVISGSGAALKTIINSGDAEKATNEFFGNVKIDPDSKISDTILDTGESLTKKTVETHEKHKEDYDSTMGYLDELKQTPG